jgi:hypothetical protein
MQKRKVLRILKREKQKITGMKMKRELSKYWKALSQMIKAIWQGKYFWVFPKPLMEKVEVSNAHLREGRKRLKD